MAEKEEGAPKPAAPAAGQKGVFTDIKNQLIESNQHQLVTATAVQELSGSFQKMIIQQDQSRLDQLEKDRESAQKVAAGQASLNSAAGSPDAAKASGGMGGILGKLLGGGAALAIGGALGAAAAAIVAILNIDTKKIKSSVKDLLSISDELGGVTKAFVDGGTFLAVMSGIGLGLAVFGVGSAIAGMSAKLLDNFASPTWAQDIIDNVIILLSLKDQLGGNILEILGSTGTFLAVMTGLGMGLAVFGIGSAVAGLSQTVLKNFGDPNWAQNIVNNAVILLGLGDKLGGNVEALKKGGTFVLAMGGIALGLMAFSLGSGVAALTQGVLDNFGDPLWATGIVNNAVILLGLGDKLGGNVEALKDGGTFFLAMTGISLGLAVFGVAKMINALGNTFNKEGWAQGIVDEVKTLLTIKDNLGQDPVAEAGKLKLSLIAIGEAVSAFAGEKFMASLKDMGSSILGFFSGKESPFGEIMQVAKQADDLEKGAKAIESLQASLLKFSNLKFDGSNVNLKKFAQDLKEAVPIIEAAIMGEQPGMIWGKGLKGLASPDIKYDEAVANVQKIQSMSLTGAEIKAQNAGIDEAGGATGSIVAPVTNNYYTTNNNNYLQGSSQAKAPTTTPMDRRRSNNPAFR